MITKPEQLGCPGGKKEWYNTDIFLKELGKVTKNVNQSSRISDRDLNRTHISNLCFFNDTLHKDLRIPQVQNVLQDLIDTYRSALQSYPNPLMAQILTQPDSRRLQRRWTLDVIT
jgi:hypothetical protein